MRISHGPGYRVSYMQTGERMVILLIGGDKSTQQSDIAKAKALAAGLRKEAIGVAKTTTEPFDAADYLKTEDDMVAYLEAVLEEDDPRAVAAALGDIARAKGMSQVARDAGLGREALYKALSPHGNPELGTVMKVVRALGLSLHARPARGTH